MERCGTAGFRNPDALLSIAGKSGKLRPGGRKVGAGGSGLLDLPLGVKIPVQPGTKPVFCRTKLGEKLHQPSPHFDLGDPYCRHLRTEYNSLHDPHLQDYHNRQDNLQNLKKRGLVTKDGKVVCTLKEFNEYRQYLTRLKLEREQTQMREELRPGGRKVGAGGSGLLDLPLGVKIPVQPGTKPVFCRTKLGEKLHQPSPHFDLGDPYCRHLRTEYNSLHDPHLQDYHNRQDNLQNLKKRGLVTKDGKVVCTLKEFNEYRQYLTRLKLEREQTQMREEEKLHQELSKLKKSARRLMMDVDELPSRPVEYIVGSPLQPHKPAGPSPSCLNLQSGQRRRRKVALMQHGLQGGSKSTGRAVKLPEKLPKPELGREGSKLPRSIPTVAASAINPQFPRDRTFRAMSKQQAQHLQEVTGTVLEEVTGKLKAMHQPACSSRRAPQKNRQRVFRSAKRAEPSEMPPLSRKQEIALMAWNVAGKIVKKVWK
ncbi:uncharacterized protein LOC101752265 isoform X6 [Gallus gallus]|uniref:uncharacterized protein LOC101752265 isoform X6 n=1 Tax=Gallus gallus TaxID=9031 RepID=UPI000D63F4FC|nr:uncharacterized protein LOC101752265 isoform X6 [Gallus gallus]|eukprot:XP_024998157.1 uncharacterized protein LOC101752265 isoform X1 [Gallus gallus]